MNVRKDHLVDIHQQHSHLKLYPGIMVILEYSRIFRYMMPGIKLVKTLMENHQMIVRTPLILSFYGAIVDIIENKIDGYALYMAT